MSRTADEVLADLQQVASDLAGAVTSSDELRARRNALFAEGKTVEPPLTDRRMADVAGISEAMVGHGVRSGSGRIDRNGRRAKAAK